MSAPDLDDLDDDTNASIPDSRHQPEPRSPHIRGSVLLDPIASNRSSSLDGVVTVASVPHWGARPTAAEVVASERDLVGRLSHDDGVAISRHGSQDGGAEEYATLEIVTHSGGELSSSGTGRQRHHPTVLSQESATSKKENKALRDFLDGIGEADVGAAPPDEIAAAMDGERGIPGSIPIEYRAYLANPGTVEGEVASPASPPVGAVAGIGEGMATVKEDREANLEMGKKSVPGTREEEEEEDDELHPIPSIRPEDSFVQLNIHPATARAGYASSMLSETNSNVSSDRRRSSVYHDHSHLRDSTNSRPGQHHHHDHHHIHNRDQPNNLVPPMMLLPGFVKRRKDPPLLSAGRFLFCTASGAGGLFCMSIPVAYALSQVRRLGYNLTSDPSEPVPVAVLAGLASSLGLNLWSL
ncbi:hypothetical protein HK101_002903, partial [Irineochytrium annulatum]